MVICFEQKQKPILNDIKLRTLTLTLTLTGLRCSRVQGVQGVQGVQEPWLLTVGFEKKLLTNNDSAKTSKDVL